jgi:Cu+-exporting ATPase
VRIAWVTRAPQTDSPGSLGPTSNWPWAPAPTWPSTSDLTLVRGDLRDGAHAIRLSRRTLRTIKTNLFSAFAHDIAALPLAVAGLLNPMIAGAAMAFSSAFAVSNSLRLRTFRPLESNR